jgi:hypothetical protein
MIDNSTLAVKALRMKQRYDKTQFTTKIGGKTSLGSQLFSFVKFSLPITRLMPYYAETRPFSPTSHVTLWITPLFVPNFQPYLQF